MAKTSAAGDNRPAQSPENKTKSIILAIAGDFTTKPADLQNSIDLKNNLSFGNDEYNRLQAKLNELVSGLKAGATISNTEATACSTVGDCVHLVQSKIV